MNARLQNARYGEVALLCAALGYAFFGPISRELGHDVQTFVQCFLRSAIAIILIAVVRPRSFVTLRALSWPQWKLEVVRAFLIGPVGTGAFVCAVSMTSLANISLILATPWTVVWGSLLFGDRMSWRGGAIVALAASGVALVGLQHGQASIHLGMGECLAVLSVAGFSLGTMLRRRHESQMSDFDLVLPLLIIIAIFHAAIAILLREHFSVSKLSPYDFTLSTAGGVIIVLNTYLSNYGLQRTHGLVANNILATETIFVMALGYLLYGERLSLNGEIGAGLILLSVVLLPWVPLRLKHHIDDTSAESEEPFTAEKL